MRMREDIFGKRSSRVAPIPRRAPFLSKRFQLTVQDYCVLHMFRFKFLKSKFWIFLNYLNNLEKFKAQSCRNKFVTQNSTFYEIVKTEYKDLYCVYYESLLY